MELKLQNGDYVPDGVGGLRRVWGREALLQRVFYKLMARPGAVSLLGGSGQPVVAAGSDTSGRPGGGRCAVCDGSPG